MGALPVCFPSFRFTSIIAVSQRRKFPMSTVLERNFESNSYYTSCHHMTMRFAIATPWTRKRKGS